jgi:hypothetical protein
LHQRSNWVFDEIAYGTLVRLLEKETQMKRLLFSTILCVFVIGSSNVKAHELDIQVSLGGIGERSGANGQWIGEGPSHAITDLSVKIAGTSTEKLKLEYTCHAAGRGDSPDWLSDGKRCDTGNTTAPILAVRFRLVGSQANQFDLCYSCRHTVAQLMSERSEGEVCGVPGSSSSDSGGGSAWLTHIKLTLKKHKRGVANYCN